VAKRAYWYVTNNTRSIIAIGDLPLLPEFLPGDQLIIGLVRPIGDDYTGNIYLVSNRMQGYGWHS